MLFMFLRLICFCAISFSIIVGCGSAFAQAMPDFAKSGRPFLEKHCLECHSKSDAKAELQLDSFQSSNSIVKQRKTWENVLRMVSSGEMPPEDQTRPTPIETVSFAQLVRDIFLQFDRNAKPDPGRVTMRRLNRVEYCNTIRDLIGVDFDPTEDFPSDEIGHGFDNIGDVLTLSPVLMERYLDHSMIAYGSGNSDGNAHNHDDLPILLAGGGCGTIKTGRHIRYYKDTPLNNLWLSMLNRMQIDIAQLGDSTGSLTKLDG